MMAGYGRLQQTDLVDGLSVKYLEHSGLWNIINDYREKGIKSRTFVIWMIVTAGGFGPLLVTSVAGPFFTEKNLEGVTLVLLNPMAAVQTVVKFAVLWYGIEKQAQLLELMKNSFMTCIPADKRPKAMEIMKKAAQKSNRLSLMGITMNSITVTVWNIMPILRSDYVRLTLGFSYFGAVRPKSHNKILGFWYPIDYDNTPWVQIVYVYEFYITAWAGFLISLLEAIIVQLVCLLTGYMQVLSYLMESMKTPVINSQSIKTNKLLLLTYIKEHQKLMKYGDDIRDLYNPLITVQFSTGLVILIIGIFNFFLGSEDGDFLTMVKFITFTFYTLVEVIIYCYSGSDMETVSQDVGFAAYSSEWYFMDVEFRKSMQMMMVRTRSAVALKAGKLYPVNLQALTNILQMAYSTSMLMFRITNG